MALTFTTDIVLPTGLTVSGAYARVAAVDNASGTKLTAGMDIYTSETAFTSGLEPIAVPFGTVTEAEYNRETNGVDILSLGHDMLVAYLSGIGYEATKEL